MKIVTAKTQREEGWWVVSVPEIQGLFTQARRLDRIPFMVKDAAELLEGISPDDLVVNIELDEGLESRLRTVRKAREQAEEAQQRTTDLTRSCAKDLSSNGLTYRDIGQLLGVSHQYAQKLAQS